MSKHPKAVSPDLKPAVTHTCRALAYQLNVVAQELNGGGFSAHAVSLLRALATYVHAETGEELL
jgi:hypothetical protein